MIPHALPSTRVLGRIGDAHQHFYLETTTIFHSSWMYLQCTMVMVKTTANKP